MPQLAQTPLAERARAALARHAWREAYDLLHDAHQEGDLSPEELELLAQAAWWVGRLPEAIEVRERAYASYTKAGDPQGAAKAAIFLGRDNFFRNQHSVAGAWLNRAARLLDGAPENPGHGWLAEVRVMQAAATGNYEEARAQAARAREIAVRFGDRDLEMLAMAGEGYALMHLGSAEQGLAMVDEATVAAVGGELDPAVAGGVCCTTIEACAVMGDWARASQWTEAQDRWCEREGITGYPGMCRLYRAEVKRLRGFWLEAEAEARRASDELLGYIPAAVGMALYEIGVIRLRRGDLPAAEEALLRGHEYGRDPEPALSMLRLAQGRTDEAFASIRRALEEPEVHPSWWPGPGTAVNRLWLLPAKVEIALAAGDVPAARSAAEEIATLSERYPGVPFKAEAAGAEGSVRVAEGDPVGGAASLREAIRLWNELDAPYDVARIRLRLAGALAAEGSPDRAAIELQAARATFERLGAVLDLRRADEALAGLQGPGGARAPDARADRQARAFVFTDIVDSTRLAELLGDEAWSPLLRWHDQALRSVVAEHGGEEIKRTGDGFFLAFPGATAAVDSAVAIQRRLAEHRASQGFAPAVRIGIHWAEANRAGQDYFGTGVNLAARVGAHAGGGQIMVSAPTLERSRRRYAELERTTVELKGIREPVEVVSIDWR